MSSEQRKSHRSTSRVCCCFMTSLSFVIIVPTLYITLILRLLAGRDIPDTTLQPRRVGNGDRTISLHADLVSANIRQSTMVVEWTILGDTCNDSCPEVNIFFDINLSPSDDRRDNSQLSNNRPTEPIFVWNATGMTSSSDSNYDVLRNAPRFSTKFNIYPVCDDFHKGLLIRHGTRAYYPFDWYWSGVTVFAQETLTNKSVFLALNSAFRIVANLEITTGVLKADPTNSENADQEEEVILAYVILKRSTLVIGYCLVITATFWLVTLMICLIMVTTVIFGFRQRNEIVVVPIGTLFAFTQLRSTMPGAHEGFDLVGVLPCLILLSICAVTMIGIYLFADPDDVSRKAFTWDDLGAFGRPSRHGHKLLDFAYGARDGKYIMLLGVTRLILIEQQASKPVV
ncbi:hypothetical protein EDD85DRAFT_973520 [Armillaria nabsnona]|nr:hypothetical protein EDD85DRAFT_973520 [Armillaria nabsnona]